MLRILIITVSLLTMLGCSSVTMRTDQQAKTHDTVSFQKTYPYWWWGLKGEHDINVREICQGKPVKQMQAVNTFTDSLSIIFTLGIYMPRTARVWCEDAEIIQ